MFGRATRKLLNELGHHAIRTPPNGKLSEATKFALRFVGSRILESRDRVVKSTSAGVFFMFTDVLLLRVIPRLEVSEAYC